MTKKLIECVFAIVVSCGASYAAAQQPDSIGVKERRDSIVEARVTSEKYAGEASPDRTGHKRLDVDIRHRAQKCSLIQVVHRWIIPIE